MWLPMDVEILGISDFFYYIVPIAWHFDIIIHYFFKSRKFKLFSYKKTKNTQIHPQRGALSQSWDYSSENDPGLKGIHKYIFP